METLKSNHDRQGGPNSLPISLRVANAMHKIGVVGLPRNYEIFYGAMTGTNAELQEELLKIGSVIDQAKLDTLFARFCAKADDEELVGKICDAVEAKLSGTISVIKNEQKSVLRYGKILDQASQRLDPRAQMPPETMNKLVTLLSSATEATQKRGEKEIVEMSADSNELLAMQKELAEYKRLAETDALTGLFNRRAFDKHLAELKKKETKQSALIIGDIVGFKAINDTYGHPFGDLVIRKVAHILKTNAREEALIARVGGEEFALLAVGISERDMVTLAERLRIAVAEEAYCNERVKLSTGKVTISFGVCHGSLAPNAQLFYSQADEALYAAKRAGRNRVTSFGEINDLLQRKKLFLYQ